MENKFLEKANRSLSTNLEYRESMDDYLDHILFGLGARSISEDLREYHFYVNRPWLEFRDDENFHAAVLHFFNDDGEYLRSVNGDVAEGNWRYLESSNKMMVTLGGETELYDLAFVDSEFFILAKHGDQRRLKRRKYFVMVYEPVGSRLEWLQVVEKLYNKHRNSNTTYYILALVIFLIVVLAVLWSR